MTQTFDEFISSKIYFQDPVNWFRRSWKNIFGESICKFNFYQIIPSYDRNATFSEIYNNSEGKYLSFNF